MRKLSLQWDPHTLGLQEELEKVRNRAARFVTGNYVFETGSMTGILGQLKCEMTLSQRIGVVESTLFGFSNTSASKEAYKSSFFPQTIRDWNDLPDSLISSAEMSDDCVSKFTSLVRARD